MLRSLSALLFAVLALSSAAAAWATEPPSDATYQMLCRAIGAQHVRALFTGTAAPVRLGGDADCAFSKRGNDPEVAGVKVFLRIDDDDQTLWAHRGDRSYGTFRWISKTGRLAKWGYQGGRLPSVVDARHGTFTCTLIPTGLAGLAIPTGPVLAAARTYALRLLHLCDDAFAAYS
ncbi:MAG TPA: hypothetical protein VLE97_07710 [Gaiellaceae bacterium]|nr:hypothetical protein [Gaiellaceae bacterium]